MCSELQRKSTVRPLEIIMARNMFCYSLFFWPTTDIANWLLHSFQHNSDITAEPFSTWPSRQPLLISQTWLSRQNLLASQDLAHSPVLPPPSLFTDKRPGQRLEGMGLKTAARYRGRPMSGWSGSLLRALHTVCECRVGGVSSREPTPKQ